MDLLTVRDYVRFCDYYLKDILSDGFHDRLSDKIINSSLREKSKSDEIIPSEVFYLYFNTTFNIYYIVDKQSNDIENFSKYYECFLPTSEVPTSEVLISDIKYIIINLYSERIVVNYEEYENYINYNKRYRVNKVISITYERSINIKLFYENETNSKKCSGYEIAVTKLKLYKINNNSEFVLDYYTNEEKKIINYENGQDLLKKIESFDIHNNPEIKELFKINEEIRDISIFEKKDQLERSDILESTKIKIDDTIKLEAYIIVIILLLSDNSIKPTKPKTIKSSRAISRKISQNVKTNLLTQTDDVTDNVFEHNIEGVEIYDINLSLNGFGLYVRINLLQSILETDDVKIYTNENYAYYLNKYGLKITGTIESMLSIDNVTKYYFIMNTYNQRYYPYVFVIKTLFFTIIDDEVKQLFIDKYGNYFHIEGICDDSGINCETQTEFYKHTKSYPSINSRFKYKYYLDNSGLKKTGHIDHNNYFRLQSQNYKYIYIYNNQIYGKNKLDRHGILLTIDDNGLYVPLEYSAGSKKTKKHHKKQKNTIKNKKHHKKQKNTIKNKKIL